MSRPSTLARRLLRRVPNPVRGLLVVVGRALARAGLVDAERVERTTELSWPRVVTGLARMSKNAADVAMVGLAAGPAAIAGVGFASPFWGLAFALGGGVAGGTISLVSQRYGADAHGELGRAIKASGVATLAVTLPVAALFLAVPGRLVGVLGAEPAAREAGGAYLRVVALGVPFAGLNLVGSRALVGTDDAYTPMVLRGGGAVVNVGLNAVLVFGFDLGVVGAALGTVAANVLVAAAFAYGFLSGGLPHVGAFPVAVDPWGGYLDRGLLADLADISTPLAAANLAGNLAQYPLLFLVGLLGTDVVAAFVVAQRVRALLNTPGWGFSLASSSLVGQQLGADDEAEALAYGREIVRFAVAVYLVGAVLAVAFAEPIVGAFVEEPSTVPLAVPLVRVAAVSVIFWGVSGVPLVRVAAVSVVFWGVSGAATGPLRAAGDTDWPMYAQLVGRYGFAVPFAALAAYTPVGVVGLSLVLLAESAVPAAVNYYRFAAGDWLAVSREYRPDEADGAAADADPACDAEAADD